MFWFPQGYGPQLNNLEQAFRMNAGMYGDLWSIAQVAPLFFESWFWVNYNELTTTSLEIIVSKGKYPQIALIQVSELL